MSSIYIQEPATNGKVCLKTSVGDIDIELWSKECPLACRNFVQLCMEGYYNGTIFHRLVNNFIVQGGDPTGTGMGGESIYGQPFKDEFHQRLRFSRRGLVAMANSAKNDNGSQFFFTLDQTPELQNKHTLFGKVVGSTLFNMLKLGESEADQNERPLNPQKIIGAEILLNPFEDIVPRELPKNREEKSKQKKPQSQMKATKNFSLLSFGDEAEEEEEVATKVSQKLAGKGKSAHDILAEENEALGLSSEPAVRREELGDDAADDATPVDEEEMSRVRSRIRDKLNKKQSKHVDARKEDDPDLEQLIESEEQIKARAKVDNLKAELKSLQKDYMKALRKPKPKVETQEEVVKSEGLLVYEELRNKFLANSKGLVKQKETGREDQTMKMLSKFKTRLDKSNREAILFDRKPKVAPGEEQKEDEKTSERLGGDDAAPSNLEESGRLDLDAEDVEGDDWMAHKFVAPEEDSGVSRAKDANMRDVSEDWYDIYDPRNPMNQRRREELAAAAAAASAAGSSKAADAPPATKRPKL
uniref:Spliceosome-associated protein CWC27 homolog n=1 Tax=Plectus sambesii TaxID=2011161 RepID=A0A914W671_9BILA